MKKDLRHAFASSTQKQYSSNWASFKLFAKSINRSYIPASRNTISLFVTFLHNTQKLKSTTIRTYLSAVTHYHNLNGFDSKTDNFMTETLLNSYAKTDPPPRIRLAITSKILCKLLSSI